MDAPRSRAGPPHTTVGPVVLVLVLVVVGLLGGTPMGRAAATSTPLTGGIHGPTFLGEVLKGNYTVTATGGPAEAANGSQVGVYSFKASLAGANTTAAFVTPTSGVLVNQTITLSVSAPNATETLTLYVAVTSGLDNNNVTQNFSYAIAIVQPYRLSAMLFVGSGASLAPMRLAVTLDGTPVGSILVGTLQAGSTYPISFSYVTQGLSPGWHTFAVSLANLHGLVTFANGTTEYTQSFYVVGPPPDYTLWYLSGAVALAGVVFIWLTRVGARRRTRAKK